MIDTSLTLISSSIYIDSNQVGVSYQQNPDMQVFVRFAEKWQRDFAKPLFQEFTQAFTDSMKVLFEDSEFQEILKVQIARDSNQHILIDDTFNHNKGPTTSDAEIDEEITSLIHDIAQLEFKKTTLKAIKSIARDFEAFHQSQYIEEGLDYPSMENLMQTKFEEKL